MVVLVGGKPAFDELLTREQTQDPLKRILARSLCELETTLLTGPRSSRAVPTDLPKKEPTCTQLRLFSPEHQANNSPAWEARRLRTTTPAIFPFACDDVLGRRSSRSGLGCFCR
jgi:hypothetical protein